MYVQVLCSLTLKLVGKRFLNTFRVYTNFRIVLNDSNLFAIKALVFHSKFGREGYIVLFQRKILLSGCRSHVGFVIFAIEICETVQEAVSQLSLFVY